MMPSLRCVSVMPPKAGNGRLNSNRDSVGLVHATPTSPRTNYSITTTNFHFAIWDTFDLP